VQQRVVEEANPENEVGVSARTGLLPRPSVTKLEIDDEAPERFPGLSYERLFLKGPIS
jgi:hypothetical protein